MKRAHDEYVSLLLMNRDTPVLQFLYDEETHSVAKIERVVSESHAPLGIVDYKTGIPRKALNDWWQHRAIPASRENFSRILQDLRIGSSLELLEKCSGFSLSDQYWVKASDSPAEWKELNFFENKFSEDIGKLLLGQTDARSDLCLISPDNATGGDLVKKWKIIDGDRCLIKGGNSLNNQEPYNEVVATRLYERVLAPGEFVPYDLLEDEGKMYSSCKTMVTVDEELVSALAIDGTTKQRGNQSFYDHFILSCRELGIPDAEIMVDKMLTCDYILANYDRHYRNFGAIRNVETLSWKGFAPIYDSGSSLWARTATPEISPFNYNSKPFKSDHQKQFMLVRDLSWLDEKRLLGFENDVRDVLSQNPLMDEQRISLISHHVKNRVNEVLERKHVLEGGRKAPLSNVIHTCEARRDELQSKLSNDPARQPEQKGKAPER